MASGSFFGVVQLLGFRILFGKGGGKTPNFSQCLDNFRQINVETMRFLLSMKKAPKNRFTGGYQRFT